MKKASVGVGDLSSEDAEDGGDGCDADDADDADDDVDDDVEIAGVDSAIFAWTLSRSSFLTSSADFSDLGVAAGFERLVVTEGSMALFLCRCKLALALIASIASLSSFAREFLLSCFMHRANIFFAS